MGDIYLRMLRKCTWKCVIWVGECEQGCSDIEWSLELGEKRGIGQVEWQGSQQWDDDILKGAAKDADVDCHID